MELLHTNPLSITVANGEKLYSTAKCKQLEWLMHGHSFTHDFRVLSMGGSDMVIGVDWMKRFSPLTLMQKPRVSWNEFVNDLCQRFSDRTYADTIEEFNKLSQKSTLDEYQEKFEKLKPYMLQFNSNLLES